MALRFDMMTMSDAMHGYLINAADKSEFDRKRHADEQFDRDVRAIKRLAPDAEMLALINRAAEMDSQSVNRLEDEVLDLISKNQIDAAKEKYVREYLPVRHEQESVIRQMEELTEKSAAQAYAAAQSRYQAVRTLTIFLVSLLIIAGTILSLIIAGSIANPIVRMAAVFLLCGLVTAALVLTALWLKK